MKMNKILMVVGILAGTIVGKIAIEKDNKRKLQKQIQNFVK